MTPATYLIVEQQQHPAENLPEVLKELSQKHHLDLYQTRQRLVGRGLSLLINGQPEPLQKISQILQEAGFTHWLVSPSKPQFAPQRLRSLHIENDKITFYCQKKNIIFPKGATILAVFADMSGELADKNVKQLLSSHAYRGRHDVRHLEDHKIHRSILQGEPLLDLYLLDEQKTIVDAVRIFPGKFDPKGLGERATVSSKQNLDRILTLAKEYSGSFSLFTDFGLVNLPGCTLRRENPKDPDTHRKNQISLARYGWLLADLVRVGPVNPPNKETSPDLTGTVTAALLMQNPALLATEQIDGVEPVVTEIVKEVNNAAAEQAKTKPAQPILAEAGLPAPPPPKKTSNWNKLSFWLGSSGAALAVISIIVLEIDNRRVIGTLLRHAFTSGTLPLVFSALLFWSSFHLVRLKRLIENTPTSKIRSIAMGMVEVKGQAIRQYALISPMSQVACVYYRLTKYHRKNSQWEITSSSGSDNVPFLIEDETGLVEVDPSGCRVSTGTRQEGTPGQLGLTRFSDDSDEKWVEEIIIEGTLVYVLGFAAIKKDSGPSFSVRKIEALREFKRNPQNILQFDADGDGKISEDEWDTARAAVEEKVLREELEKKQSRKKQEEHVVIGKKKNRPLIITETPSEDHLTRRYMLYSIVLFIAALASSGWGIYALLGYIK